jgi:general secretion pathway protein E
MRLGEILVRKGYAQPAQIDAALAQQSEETPRRRIGEMLCADRIITAAMLAEALAEQFGVEWIPTVDDALLAPDLLDRLSVDWARTRAMLPVRQDGRVRVLTADPSDITALDDLALLLGLELAPLLAPRDEILRAIERAYVRKERKPSPMLDQWAAGEVAPTERGSDDLLRASDQAPVTQLVNLMLLDAVKKRASDVHVEPFENHVQVRFRIDGFLYAQPPPPKQLEAALISRLKVMARLDIAERRLPQDGMAKVRVGEREFDIRVSTVPVAEGERVVLRLLNREALALPLDSLGLPGEIERQFKELLREPNGIILVTGPTGSGKTTTLYAALRCLDTQHTNVLTIEDPIEYQLPGIGQIQVRPKIGLTFAQGLRHILRQDPDVVFVGEIRDLETAEIALRASLTGHLVFSTLHTNDAVSAVLRLQDMGIAPYLLGAALRAVMAQRLVRCLCPQCRAPDRFSEAELRGLGLTTSVLRESTIWRPRGCPQCLNGYRNRTGIYELLVVDSELQEAVRRGEDASALRMRAVARRHASLLQAGLTRVLDGTTSAEELLRVLGGGGR